MARWVAWGRQSARAEVAPDLGFVEPLLRRRLSPLARAALHVANVCSEGYPSLPLVYASRHGELGRTVELLRNLAAGEDLSPTTFGLSVLNSAAGIFSIARGDHAPATAIAAGPETFGFGLLEAYVRARLDPGTPVLYLYADTPAPGPLGPQPGDPASPLTVAMLIDDRAEHLLNMSMQPQRGDAGPPIQALACLAALDGVSSRWSSGHREWRWEMQPK